MKKLWNYIFFWFVDQLPPCSQIIHNIDKDMVEKINLKDRVLIRLHLTTCPWCTNYRHQTHVIENALTRLSENPKELPIELPELAESSRQSMQQQILDNLSKD